MITVNNNFYNYLIYLRFKCLNRYTYTYIQSYLVSNWTKYIYSAQPFDKINFMICGGGGGLGDISYLRNRVASCRAPVLRSLLRQFGLTPKSSSRRTISVWPLMAASMMADVFPVILVSPSIRQDTSSKYSNDTMILSLTGRNFSKKITENICLIGGKMEKKQYRGVKNKLIMTKKETRLRLFLPFLLYMAATSSGSSPFLFCKVASAPA